MIVMKKQAAITSFFGSKPKTVQHISGVKSNSPSCHGGYRKRHLAEKSFSPPMKKSAPSSDSASEQVDIIVLDDDALTTYRQDELSSKKNFRECQSFDANQPVDAAQSTDEQMEDSQTNRTRSSVPNSKTESEYSKTAGTTASSNSNFDAGKCFVSTQHHTSSSSLAEREARVQTTDSEPATAVLNSSFTEEDLENALSACDSDLSPEKPTTAACAAISTRTRRLKFASQNSLAAKFGRYQVTDVSASPKSVKLKLKSLVEGDQNFATVELHGLWTLISVRCNDVVNIVNPVETGSNQFTVTDNNGALLILEPDFLVNSTAVAGAQECLRKTVLEAVFRGGVGGSVQMLVGSLLHAVFQELVLRRLRGRPSGPTEMDRLVSGLLGDFSTVQQLYAMGLDDWASVKNKFSGYVDSTQRWLGENLTPDSRILSAPSQTVRKRRDLQITQLRDIEENIWSPRLGLKGKIDLLVQTRQNGNSTQELLPLELKTGKEFQSMQHRGQVVLYNMMSPDRSRPRVDHGLLVYLQTANTVSVRSGYADHAALTQRRNELAHYMIPGRSKKPPEPCYSSRTCKEFCDSRLACCVLTQCQGGLPASAGYREMTEEETGHLTVDHLAYFRHWYGLMCLEAAGAAVKVDPANLWCLSGAERAERELGKSLHDLILLSSPADTAQALQTGSRCSFGDHRLRFRAAAPLAARPAHTQFAAGDMVVVSASQSVGLTTGHVVDVGVDELTVRADNDLSAFRASSADAGEQIRFQLDAYPDFGGGGVHRLNQFNLICLMSRDEHASRVRRLIVDRQQPRVMLQLPRSVIQTIQPVVRVPQLNRTQKTAVLRSLMCEDYLLVSGYPGAGKTSTVAAMIRVALSLGQAVLLTSFTHSAVDTVLLKLLSLEPNLSFLRLGSTGRCHPDLRAYTEASLRTNIRTATQLHQFYQSFRLVASTCHQVSTHALFHRQPEGRVFDLCIVDEATQVFQPTCLAALYHCSRFVLVGDPFQLPPLVVSEEAKTLGAARSLFETLADSLPDDSRSHVRLCVQYRMNSEVQRIPNSLVYSGQLQCGTAEIASRTVHVDLAAVRKELPEIKFPLKQPDFMRLFSSDLHDSVLFLNTDQLIEAHRGQLQSGRKRCNPLEVQIVSDLVRLFLCGGVRAEDIGVISPYQAQVKLVASQLSDGVDVNTIDQYQGRDKRVILLSFVRWPGDNGDAAVADDSSGSGGGDILCDIARLNVALTRAKEKLILLGSRCALNRFPPVQRCLQLLTDDQSLLLL